ncbi:MAG: alanine dehydrogenase [Desulfobacterales bacterium]|jgi:alanine dehydrogenase|nr:alanine dehydrogenase [Desulfobacterales bacterium]
MLIGILKEVKSEENRVAMTPAGVEVLCHHGHRVVVEKNAGRASGFPDASYLTAGAQIIHTAQSIYRQCDMVMHVKEPIASEYDWIREHQIIFTYLHLAANKQLTKALMKRKSVNIAYETIQTSEGALPLLTPMSEVAGRMAIQQAAKYLEMIHGGRGVLLGGVPGVDPATVLILGGGTVGVNAAKMACGLGAKVYLLDLSLERLRYLSNVMPPNCFLLFSSPQKVREIIGVADVIVGAILIPGAKAPRLITRDMIKTMKKGAVIVDVAIDQGGCFETSKPTTHADPIYTVDGVVHYCVTNMPGAVPKTSTWALSNATLPYALEIADKGWVRAMRENEEIRRGANIVNGKVTHQQVAEAFGLVYTPIDTFL